MEKKDSPKEEAILHTKDGQAFDVPVHGSLGLLALGDIGLILWRQKKLEYLAAMEAEIRKNAGNNKEENT